MEIKFWLESLKRREENHKVNLGTDVRIILRWNIIKRGCGIDIWLRMRSSDRFL
jgi:hypothetical protein